MNFQTVLEELDRIYEELPAKEATEKEVEVETEPATEALVEEATEDTEEVVVADEPIVDDEVASEEEIAEEPTDETKQVVLECSKCGAIIIKEDTDVKVDAESSLANVGDVCQYCEEDAGYNIVGTVAPYEAEEVAEEAEEVAEEDVVVDEADAVEEGLFSKKLKEPYEVLPSQLKKGMTVIGPDGDEYKIKDVTIDGKNIHILHKDGSISTSDAMSKKYKVIAE